MNIAADIRSYALRSTRSLRAGDTMVHLEHALCESFLTTQDWDVHSLWSVEWRTFALLVAEAVETDGAGTFTQQDRQDLLRVGRYLDSDNVDDGWLPHGEWQRLAATLRRLGESHTP